MRVPLTDRDKAIIDFERSWWVDDSTKEAGIRARFGLSTTRYYQLVAAILDDPAAMAYDPLVVRRLRRLRDQRRRARYEGRPGSQSKGR